LFALTFVVIGNEQMAFFAAFGSFATLVMAAFGGTRRDKAKAHLGLAVAGSVALIIGTLVSGIVWLAVVVTVPVAFLIFFAAAVGPNAASGVSAALLAYVLPVTSAGGASTLPSRLAGWWLASVVGTAAVLLLSRPSPGDRLRARAADLAAAIGRELDAAMHGRGSGSEREATVAAKHALMQMFAGTPYRPIGLAAADEALATLIQLLEWCAAVITGLPDGQLDLRDAGPEDGALLNAAAATLGDTAMLLSGVDVSPDLARLEDAQAASADHFRRLSGDPDLRACAERTVDAQTIALAVAGATANAMVATRRASPDLVDQLRYRWFDVAAPVRLSRAGVLARVTSALSREANVRSVWLQNSMRGAAALALAVAVADVSNVQHSFWVVLGALSVLRTSAAATGATAMRALGGTVAGFIVGAALLVGIGTNTAALWAALPLAVLAASYAPGTTPFLVGQAAFTVTVVVLFNLLVPAGWHIGLLRVEDVAIGSVVSVVVGVLFWPRGASAVVGNDLADVFRSSSRYLTEAVDWALAAREQPPGMAPVATAAASRLDDALRNYLNEQGSKRLPKDELWTLVMAGLRLRLTAHSIGRLPGLGPAGSAETCDLSDLVPAHVSVRREAAELAGYYEGLAAQVGAPGPGHATPDAPDVAAASTAVLPPCPGGDPGHFHPNTLWVHDHLMHLRENDAAVSGPAEHLAKLRRRPWWR
jgi:uncharacterized membrane protein YccC